MTDPVPFITVADLDTFAGSGQDTAAGDFACAAACAIVRGYIGTEITLEEDVEVTLDGTGTDTLPLPSPPVREVASVVECETDLVEGDDYLILYGAGVLIRKACSWPAVRGAVVVTYSRGYDFGDDVLYPGSGLPLPADIRLVAVNLAKRIVAAGALPVGGFTRETIGAYTYEKAADSEGVFSLEKGETAILGRYRPVGVA